MCAPPSSSGSRCDDGGTDGQVISDQDPKAPADSLARIQDIAGTQEACPVQGICSEHGLCKVTDSLLLRVDALEAQASFPRLHHAATFIVSRHPLQSTRGLGSRGQGSIKGWGEEEGQCETIELNVSKVWRPAGAAAARSPQPACRRSEMKNAKAQLPPRTATGEARQGV
jgi:hypothetical protein